jgi:hypothetical protein
MGRILCSGCKGREVRQKFIEAINSKNFVPFLYEAAIRWGIIPYIIVKFDL